MNCNELYFIILIYLALFHLILNANSRWAYFPPLMFHMLLKTFWRQSDLLSCCMESLFQSFTFVVVLLLLCFYAALWRTSSIWLGNTERSTQTDQNGYRKAIIDLLSRHIFASLVRVVLPHSGHNAEDKLNHKATSNGSFSGRMRQTPPHIQLPLSATPTQQLTIAAMNTYIPHHSSCCVNHVVTFLGRCT